MDGWELTLAHILLVLLAHYIADYPWQGQFIASMKGQYDYLLFCHCVIWAGCCCAMLGYLGLFAWWKLFMLFAGHMAIDRWKAHHVRRESEGLTRLLWIDQGLHAVQVVVAVIA